MYICKWASVYSDTDCTDPMPILNQLCHQEKVGGVSSGSDTEDTADSSKHKHVSLFNCSIQCDITI